MSSKGQDYTAQVEALKAGGCDRIFSEKASGKSTHGRPEFAKLQKVLLPGDTVVVTKLDRLARSTTYTTSFMNWMASHADSYRLGRAVRHDY